MVIGFKERLVLTFVHELLQLTRITQFHPEQPTLRIAVGVDETRCFFDSGVLFRDSPRNWSVNLTGSLHTLQSSTLIRLLELGTNIGQLSVDNFSESLLSMVRDSNGSDLPINQNPLMFLCVKAVCGME